MADRRIESKKTRAYLRKKFKKDFSAQKKLLDLAIKSMDGLEKDQSKLRGIFKSYYLTATYALFLKGFNTYWAAYNLCREGFGTESLILVRSLFNIFLNLIWISLKDQEKRGERFLAFDIVHRKYDFDKRAKYNVPPMVSPQVINETGKLYQKVKKKYNLTGDPVKDKWSGKTYYKMALDVRLQKDYDLLYGPLSDIEHSGATSLPRYIGSEKGRVILRPGPLDKWIKEALVINFNYFYAIFKKVSQIVGIGGPSKNIARIFKNLYGFSITEP